MRNLLFFTLPIMLLFGCANEEASKSFNESKSVHSKNIQYDNEYEYEIFSDEYLLNVQIYVVGNVHLNKFKFTDKNSGKDLFELEYSFDTTEEEWKAFQQQKALSFSNELKSLNLGIEILKDLNFLLDESYLELFDQVSENELKSDNFSGIAYLKSAVAANIRAINEESDQITGTISPFFLVDKSLFAFQEDIIYKVEDLRNDIPIFVEHGNQSESSLKIIDFIKNTTKSYVSFDEIYEFYISKELYQDFISNITIYKAGDCSETCIVGCGTDWGCCGSYMGCCLLSADICMKHDLDCSRSNCKPMIYCLPGCKPDYGDNRPVKFIMIKFME